MENVAIAEGWSVAEVRAMVLHAPRGLGARVFLFGSRAGGEAPVTSDIDVAILPLRRLPSGVLAALREALEESTVPQTVDLVDLSEADPAFRERVLAEGVEWHA